MRYGRHREPFQCSIVIDIVVDDEPAMPMTRVFAVAHVGDDQQIGQLPLDRPNRPLDDSAVVISAARVLVLVGRYAEEKHATDPKRNDFLAFLHQTFYRKL